MGRWFHQQHVQVVEVGPGVRRAVGFGPRLAQCLIDAEHPVLDADLAEPGLHGFRFDEIELEPARGDGVVGGMLDGAAGRHDDVAAHRPVRHQMGAQHVVLGPVPLHQHRSGTGTDVEKERGAQVREVDEVTDDVAAGDHDRVDRGVVAHQRAGQLEGGDGGGAPHVHVHAPGVGGADLVGEIDPRRPQHVLLPLLSGAEEHIDLLRIDPGLGDALVGRLHRHGVGRHGGVRDVLLVDSQLLLDHPQREPTGVGDLLGRHHGVG